MIKSQKVRSLAVTTLLTGAACVGAGCASTPKEMEGPLPTSPCPPGAKEGLKRIGLDGGGSMYIYIPPNTPRDDTIEISKGEAMARILGDWGELPQDGALFGEFIFTKSHVYGHFTRAQLKNGEIVTICMEVVSAQGAGVAKEPGSTSKKAIVQNAMSVAVVSRFD